MTRYNIRIFNYETGGVVKPIAERIAFYTRKTNEYGARRFDYLRGRTVQAPPASRYRRLIAYRDGFLARLEAERGQLA
ncbi:hypothetical protein [Paenibacillus sp. PAMC21692]|uniref:hypothetical protein n=1 Tax=Paenibacillus sp. PAMC21692 TaxID=2762320 RepID=UPI00164DA4A3|nr:hypothetical protein [Paenibacillus sp. PAMC21692]QNK54544.1 hypothetical protein H7F31_17940 [Paenibacillus sp. PAMC21692]